jgi:hypothetical protein
MQPADLGDGRWGCRLLFPHSKGRGAKRVGWQQTAKGLLQISSNGEEAYELHDPMTRSLERLKWFL